MDRRVPQGLSVGPPPGLRNLGLERVQERFQAIMNEFWHCRILGVAQVALLGGIVSDA